MRYAGLKVTDATGRELSARLRAGAGSIAIEIDDKDATYPGTVDPLLTSPAWTAESDQVEAQFGYSVSTAGKGV